jgi:hypothetical protein
MGYAATFKKPVIRWVSGQGWIGDASDVTKIIAKRGQQTVVMTDKYFDVMGLGNYEEALLAIVKNGWAPRILLKAPPNYKKIDGIFYINRTIALDDLKDELKKIPGASVSYNPDVSLPVVVLKLAKPKWTYQFLRTAPCFSRASRTLRSARRPSSFSRSFLPSTRLCHSLFSTSPIPQR